MSFSPSTILVTGGSGYLASWVIKHLLEDGKTVRATVRDKSKTEKYQHLLDMAAQASGTVEVFEADLLHDGSFDEAVAGCDVVIHTASPFLVGKIKDPQKMLVEPALEGTKNVLNAVNKAESVQRVVLTSSVVAIFGDAADINETEEGIFTEKHWNTSSSLKHQPYSYSKTVAEQAAWEMAEAQNRWQLTTINPSFVMGPSLTKRVDGGSSNFMLSMLNGAFKAGLPGLHFGVVDVRDVSKAHAVAATKEKVEGRHIAANEVFSVQQFAEALTEKYGDKYPVPRNKLPKWLLYLVGFTQGFSWKFVKNNVDVPYAFDNSYGKKDLGITYRPFKETMIDHAEQLIADGLV